MTKRLLAPTLPVAAALALAFFSSERAQEKPPLTGVVTGEGFTRVKIALPDAHTDGPARDAAREIVETVRADLDFSGFFEVVSPALYGSVAPTGRDRVPFDDWLSIGADHVALSRVARRQGRLDLQAWLFDNGAKQQLLARRYGGSEDLLRRVAHQLADDLVLHFTGKKGIAMTRIAFVSSHGKAKDLYLMDYDGRRVRRLTTSETINLTPAWSPVGERLAYVSWREGRPGLYVLEGDGRIRKVPTAGGTLNTSPEWAPDGNRLAYASNAEGNVEIYLAELSSGRSRRLTHSPGIDTSPTFSPNGREIAFTSDRSGTPQIYVMDVDGLNVRRLTTDGEYNESAAWSPRGDRLAYVTRSEGRRFDILLLDLATGATRRLTNGEGTNENPRWSPDGRHVVFASNRAGTFDIYTMDAAGGSARRLTRGADSITPDWSH